MGKIIIGTLLWLGIVPFLMGALLLSFLKREDDGAVQCMVTGYLEMFAVCQILIVPLILTEVPFHVFSQMLAVVYLIMAAVGLDRNGSGTAASFLDNLYGSWRSSGTGLLLYTIYGDESG